MYKKLIQENIKILLIGLAAYIIVGSIIFTAGFSLISDFEQRHVVMGEKTVQAVASQVSDYVVEKQRLVKLFAEDHLDIIRKLEANPDNDEIHIFMENRIRTYFPDFFSFTITDQNGKPEFEDFEGLLGDLCKQELDQFSKTGQQLPRLHPHPDAYHFDVMAPFGYGGKGGILFVSFNVKVLSRFLAASQSPGHHVMLLYPPGLDLIEITADGERVKWPRDDYRLSASELENQIVRVPVDKTRWVAADFYQSGFLDEFRMSVVKRGTIVFTLFSLIIALVFRIWIKAMKVQKEVERHKNDFVSVVSHELRTPLTSIRGSLGLLQGGAVGGEMNAASKDLVGIALQNCERLVFLINDILDVQKIEAGQMELSRRPVTVSKVISRCLTQISGYASGYNVRFTVNDESSSAEVFADEARLDQVIVNLLSNAVKYGAQNDTVEISIVANAETVTISIRDHGEGVPEAFRSRLFTKFSQFDSSITRKDSGTGLGLSIVKMIIEKHRGKVRYEASPDGGSVFGFVLPRWR